MGGGRWWVPFTGWAGSLADPSPRVVLYWVSRSGICFFFDDIGICLRLTLCGIIFVNTFSQHLTSHSLSVIVLRLSIVVPSLIKQGVFSHFSSSLVSTIVIFSAYEASQDETTFSRSHVQTVVQTINNISVVDKQFPNCVFVTKPHVRHCIFKKKRIKLDVLTTFDNCRRASARVIFCDQRSGWFKT